MADGVQAGAGQAGIAPLSPGYQIGEGDSVAGVAGHAVSNTSGKTGGV